MCAGNFRHLTWQEVGERNAMHLKDGIGRNDDDDDGDDDYYEEETYDDDHGDHINHTFNFKLHPPCHDLSVFKISRHVWHVNKRHES